MINIESFTVHHNMEPEMKMKYDIVITLYRLNFCEVLSMSLKNTSHLHRCQFIQDYGSGKCLFGYEED